MKFLPSFKSLKQKLGVAIYYGAIPIMIIVGIKSAMNSIDELEQTVQNAANA